MSDQPGGEPPIFDLAPAEVLPERPPSSRRPVLLTAGAAVVVLVLVLAGAGVKRLIGVASHPDGAAGAVPASTFAYLHVDLAPSAEQRLALFNFSRKFPGSPTSRPGAHAGDLRDALLSEVLKDSPISYDVDVKSWLGDDVALAAFADGSGRARVIGALAVKDRGAATASLRRITAKEHEAFLISGDYAIVAPDQATLAAARTELAKGRLDGQSAFAADVATLPADQLLTTWVDVGKGLRSAERLVTDSGCRLLSSLVPTRGGGCTVDSVDKLLRSSDSNLGSARLVAGARAASDYVDLQLRLRGGATPAHVSDVSGMLAALPDDTALALGIGAPGDALRQKATTFSTAVGEAALGARRGDGLPQLRRELLRSTGLSFPGDFAAVLGDRAVLAATRANDSVDIGVRSHPSDIAAARRLAARFAAKVDRPGERIAVRTAGGDLVIGSGEPYASRLAASGRLGSTALFRTAMGSYGNAQLALYANLRAFGVSAKESPIAAAGLVVRHDGADAVAELRIVAG